MDNTRNLYFYDAFKEAYQTNRSSGKSVLASLLKGIVSFFCGFKIKIIKNISTQIPSKNGENSSTIITSQVPQKNLLDKHVVPVDTLTGNAEITSGAELTMARKVFKKWKNHKRKNITFKQEGCLLLTKQISHKKRMAIIKHAMRIKINARHSWSHLKPIDSSQPHQKVTCVTDPVLDAEFGLVIKAGTRKNSDILPVRENNMAHATKLKQIMVNRNLIHLNLPKREFFQLKDFPDPKDDSPKEGHKNPDSVIIEEYIENTLNVDDMPDFYMKNKQRFNGVASNMTQLVHAGVYLSDLIQNPVDKSYRNFIENGFLSNMTAQDTIDQRVEDKKTEKAKAVEETKQTKIWTAKNFYEKCMTAFLGMRIRHDNLLFHDVGSDQLQGVLVDIDDIDDASALSVEHRYMDLFIMFYGNYDKIIETMSQLGLSLTDKQQQFFSFVSNVTKKAQKMQAPLGLRPQPLPRTQSLINNKPRPRPRPRPPKAQPRLSKSPGYSGNNLAGHP